MKNFWLARRKSRLIKKIVDLYKAAVNNKLWLNGLKGGMPSWQKKDTKTQP
jgi:hypothetical protein